MVRTAPLLLVLLACAAVVAGDAPPVSDGERVALEQLANREYDQAVEALRALVAERPDAERASLWRAMTVRALSSKGDHAAAAEAGAAVLATDPGGRWSGAVRFLVVDALVELGQEREAAGAALAGLDALTSPGARAAVADLYLRAAARAFEGVTVGEGPFRREGKPDLVRALRLYRGARSIGVRPTARVVVDERVVRCLLATKVPADAAREAADALTRAEDDAPHRVLLMALQVTALARAGSFDAAKRAATDLLDAHPKDPACAEALLALGDLDSLLLVRDRFADLEEAQDAAWRAAATLEKSGDARRAMEAYRLLLDRYPDHEKAAEADFRVGEILLATGEHDAAAKAFATHRSRHPLSPFWTKARQRAVDARYLEGKALLDAGDRAGAFAAWRSFTEAHPLDTRVPSILLSEGAWHGGEERFEEAYAVWHRIRTRYRATKTAPTAALRIAKLFEEEVGDVGRSVGEYRSVVEEFPKSAEAKTASGRLRVLQEETLALRLPRAFRTDETPHLEIRTRNLDAVTARIYAIDLAEYFRRRGTVFGLEDVLVEVIRPDESLRREVPGYEDYREVSWKLEIPRPGPGGAIVVVEGKRQRAVTLLLVSDLTVITKEWHDGALAFVQDAATGAPRPDVEVLARGADGKRRVVRTGADGVAKVDGLHSPIRLLAVHEGSLASDEFAGMDREIRGRETLVHVSTDRPLYRPGHTVAYRVIARDRTGDQVRNLAGEEVVAWVQDRVGNTLHRQETRLSAHGTLHGAFDLPADLPPGSYAIRVEIGRRRGVHEGGFQVEEYVKPDVLLAFAAERDAVIRGETVRATVTARYAFGKPIAGLRLALSVRGKPAGEIVTDAAGEAVVEVAADRVGDLLLALTGRDVARRRVQLAARVVVAERGYTVALDADPERVPAGEELRVRVSALDPLGSPVAREGRLRVLRAEPGSDLFSPVLEPLPAATGEDGHGLVRLRLDRPGRYRLRWEGRDRRDGEVAGVAEVEVLDAKDLKRVTVRADRETYAEGETARVAVRSPGAGRALVTLEGQRVYGHRIVTFPAGAAEVALELRDDCVPDVRIRVALLHDGALWTGGDHVRVERRLNVELVPSATRYGPGDRAVVTVRTTDARGEPVSAELALAVVDEAIYALREDDTPDLLAFFLPPEREDLVRTGSSLDFAYAGVTSRLADDLLAERDRRKRPAKESVMLEEDLLSDAPFDGPSTNASIGIGGGAGGRFGGRGGRRNLRAEGGGSAAGPAARVRKDFADTAHWSGSLVTGPDGKGTVTFRVPDNLTTWRITGRAVDRGAGFGEGRGSFVCAKDLAVLIAAPPVLRDGDTLTAAASIHNSAGRALDAQIDLEASRALYGPFGGTRRSLPDGADAALDWKLEAPSHGDGVLAARVRAGDLSDAEERRVRVLPYGVPIRTGTSGSLDAPVDWRTTLPSDVVGESLRGELRLAPSVSAQVVSALEELAGFPYGCVEQTVNRFYPALQARRAMTELGRTDPALARRLDAAVRAGIRRLTYLQRSDGSWGWWRRGGTNATMTAYAALALAEARAAKHAVPDAALDRAIGALDRLSKSERDEDVRAFLRYARVAVRGDDLSGLADSYARRGKLSARGQGWLALACARAGQTAKTEGLARELRGRVEIVNGTARIRAGAAGRGSVVEASSLALRALLAADVDAELADRLALGLAAARTGRSFGTTIDTGAAVLALTDYLLRRDAGAEGYRVEVRVNDAEPMVVEVDPEASGRERVVKLPAEVFRAGENRVRIRRVGGGRGTYALSVSGVARTAPAAAAGTDLALTRAYALQADLLRAPVERSSRWPVLRPGGGRREPDVTRVEVGDVVRVTLEVAVRPGLRFLQIEDPLPAGFSAIVGTTEGPADETVVHEDRVVFFVADPSERLTIRYLARAGFAGDVRVPPGRVFPMYRPALVAYSAARRIGTGLPGTVDRPLAAGLSPEAIVRMAQDAERKDPDRASRLVGILLGRFDVTDQAAEAMLRLQARAEERLGRPAGVLAAYDRLAELRPGLALSLEDAIRVARSANRVDRPADAIAMARRAAALLYDRDRVALEELKGEVDRQDLALILAGRYPFSPAVEADLVRLARQEADAHDAGLPAAPVMASPVGLLRTRALYPESPGAGELALRHARSRLRAGEWAQLEREAGLAAELYADHVVRAEADWFHAYALFAQERYEDAIREASASLSRGKYRLRDGRRGRTPYRRNLLHLLAQAHHVRGNIEKALAYYEQLVEVSPDAAAVVRELTAMRLDLPARLRAPTGEHPTLTLTTRNVGRVRLRVYPIDLLTYFALRQDLDRLHKANLDGLAPAVRTEVDVKGHTDRKVHETSVSLPVEGPGVYLVLAESSTLRASGVVLVSDLALTVRRVGNGVRAMVTDARTGAPVKGAYVKVTSGGSTLGDGVTDARGVFDTTGRRDPEPPVEEVEEVVEPGGSARVAVVAEKEGHAAAWW